MTTFSHAAVAEVKAEVKLEPAAQPADADFTNVGVQFLMAPYYCEPAMCKPPAAAAFVCSSGMAQTRSY